MEIRLPKEYLIREDDGYMPTYIIKPPTGIEILNGYILRMPQKNAAILDDAIVLYNGNEWDKKLRHHLFMFEKEVKVKGKTSKRYRYNEREAFMLYKHIDEQKVKARAEVSQKGSGKLIRASYSDYIDNSLCKITDWLISPDSDDKWVYEFYYDPLTNIGKHKRNARGFSILEEYPVSDIATIINSRKNLKDLLDELGYVRAMKLKKSDSGFLYKKYGNTMSSTEISGFLAYTAYNMIPKIVIEANEGYNAYLSSDAKTLLNRLIEHGSQMEQECTVFLENYKTERKLRLVREIKELTGIDLDNY